MSEFDELMRQKAVALKYNPEKNGAPVIVASGMGYIADHGDRSGGRSAGV